ncbi:MAG: hypothetical protein EKK48_19095 [Candidatus Melainabacteria bacterium]|nr:MAG: hypothetical protein EKK48_19095 [Candidatus Melainabacteria bacterium]
MKNLIISIVSQSATVPATVLGIGKKTKTLPRSKFTRNKLRERIQEQELDAEIAEALANLHNPEPEYADDYDDRDSELWDPYVEERWDHWRYGSGFTHYCGDRRWGDGWRYALERYDDLHDSDDDSRDHESCFDDDTDFEDDDFDFDPCYDDHPRCYNSELASVSETESASAYGSSEAGISLADVLLEALGLRAAMLVDPRREFDPDFGINSWWDYVPYCDPSSLLVPSPIYDRLRFSTERFVRLPGRKERFKKNKEQRGGNRRAYVDRWSKRWVDGVMVSDKNADGSRRIVKGKRSAECVEYSDFFRDKRNDWSHRDMAEALLEATDQDMAWDGKKKRNRRGGRGSKPRHSAASMYKVTLVDASRARKRLGDLGFQVEDLNAHVRSVLLKKKV